MKLSDTLENPPRAFYVGKGNEMRIKSKDRNICWKGIAKKYGHKRELIFASRDEEYIFEIEIYFICLFKTYKTDWEDGSGLGANFTRGGEGQSGKKYTEEEKEASRIKHLEIGYKHTEEAKKKFQNITKIDHPLQKRQEKI